MSENELPFNISNQITHFYIDGAYTDKVQNDQTALLSMTFHKGRIYIYNCIGIRKELYQFLEWFPFYAKNNHWSPQSRIMIELKASGFPMMSMLRTPRYGNFNALGISNKTVALGKFNRVENSEAFLASGKGVLVRGSWNQEFIEQCVAFPNATHDDMVDVLCYAIDEWFIQGFRESNKAYKSLEELGLH
jgi:phage terminase large subunit-like protein